METLKDKLNADARFDANPRKSTPINDATQLFIALGDCYDNGENIEDIPSCTVAALADLLDDDDINADIQSRALQQLAALAVDKLAEALRFAKERLVAGNEVDRVCARGIDNLLRKSGIFLP